jgi:phosphoglycolate phosphatase
MNKIERIKGLIFDLAGTIADTISAIGDGINEAMDHYGYPRKTYEDVRRAIGNGARLLIRRCMPADQTADETLCEEVFAYYHAAYARTYRNTRECYKGIPETIAALKQGGYRLAVLSNKQDEYTKGLIEQLLPRDTFEVVMGQTELPTKPSPVVPSLIAGQLGLAPSECAMIGDSDVDIQTAKNAGMAAIGCSWGYRGRAALEQAGADVVVDEAKELLQILVQKSN